MRILPIAAVLAATAVPAFAKPVTYYCEMSGGRGWIGETIALQVDQANGSAKALDGLVYSVHEEAIPGKLTINGDQMSISWRVLIQAGRGKQTYLSYRATLLAGNKSVVTAKPGDTFIGQDRASGTCQPTTEKFPGM